MDSGAFLARCWQKQPCLFRRAFPGFTPFITRQELFALSTRPAVESRLVLEQGGEAPWEVIPGPQAAEDLEHLPASHWSLLVQHVDLHRPDAAALLRRFTFIPDWRIDDLMISAAPPGGSVGPHLDSYDVFLLQAAGRRRWQINADDYSEDDFIPGLDLRILAEFRPRQEWILEPGDMLYLPPGVAHHGVALDDCLTFSIGFRAPSRLELLGDWLDDQLSAGDDTRYSDPDLAPRDNSAEITAAARARLRHLLQAPLRDDAALDRWLGRYLTRLPDTFECPVPARPDAAAQEQPGAEAGGLCCHHACRLAFFAADNGVMLYVNGLEYSLPPECRDFAATLAGARQLDREQYRTWSTAPGSAEVIRDLHERGLLLGR